MLSIKTDLNSKLELRPETLSIAAGKLSVIGDKGVVFSMSTDELEKSFIEEGLGIGKLVVKTKQGEEKEVAYFTKNKSKNFKKFSDALNQYIKENKLVHTTFKEKTERKAGVSTLYWLYGFAVQHRRLLLIGVLLSLVVVALNLIPAYLLKVLIDSVILAKTHSAALFEELTIVLLASYGISTLVSAIQSYALNTAGNRIVTSLRSKLFAHAVRLSASDIDNISTSRIQSRLISDTGNTQWLMTFGLSTVITNSLTIVGIGIILFFLFPTLALYVLLPIPFVIGLIVSYNKRADRAYHKNWRRSADLITKINDVIPNYTIIKSARREEFEGEEFNSGLKKFYNTSVDITKMELKYWQPIGFLVAIATVLIWWVGGNLVIVGTLQLGVITAFLAYMGMFYAPIQQISVMMPYLQESITSGERLREVFDSEKTGKEPKGKKKADLKKEITFKNVWFGYDPLFPVLKGVTAKIEGGKTTSIVGKSGTGKSTVAKLLLGLYTIDGGDLKFGNTSINEMDIEYLRQQVAYVPQDSSFFDETIAYNISYFSKNQIDPVRILAASKAVELHNEIMKLPLCYDNRIRGRGMSLSGGQRQRLAVARAILGDPDIVVLDEITSNLDAINARKVNNAVMRLESNKTLIFVTHDLNEIINSDRAIVLEDGVAVEQGKPYQLIRQKGRLYKMFRYKIGRAPKREPKKDKKTLESFIKGLVVDQKSISISAGERRSFVDLTYKNKKLKRLTPRMPFPVSDPGFIIFYANKDKDMIAIRDSSKLDQKSKEVLRSAIEVNNFNPKVRLIKDIKITGDGLEWSLMTDKGAMKFITKNRNDIVVKQNYVILIDEFNTPLKIDIGDLDKKSIQLLEMSV